MYGEKRREFHIPLAAQEESSPRSAAETLPGTAKGIPWFRLKLVCHPWGVAGSHGKDGVCLNVRERIINPTCFAGARAQAGRCGLKTQKRRSQLRLVQAAGFGVWYS